MLRGCPVDLAAGTAAAAFISSRTMDDAVLAAPPPEAGAAAAKVPVALGITAMSRRRHGLEVKRAAAMEVGCSIE